MKYVLLMMAFPLLITQQCCNNKKKETPSGDQKGNEGTGGTNKDSIPYCFRQIIEEAKKDNPSGLPLQIDEYLYNGQKVFLFTSECCDQFNPLFSDSCVLICSPSGGITGRGDGKCPDFREKAKHVKVVWVKKTQ